MTDAVGLYSEPVGNAVTEQPGTATFPSGAFEGQDWFGLSSMVARASGRAQVEPFGRQTSLPNFPSPPTERTSNTAFPAS